MSHFADRLLEAIRSKGSPVCVGLDPVWERLPEELKKGTDPADESGRAQQMLRFSLAILELTAPFVPAVKIQSACFERYGWRGVRVCQQVVAAARQMGLIVILDAKRSDVGISSEHYAAGLLVDRAGEPAADALTISPFLGVDAIEPFIHTAARHGKGLFALVRTSNPGSDAIQAAPLADGRSVGQLIAQLIAEAGAAYVGSRGYSLLGAVVGATKSADAAELRRSMPQQIFLVPGYGAQGGGLEDVRVCFKPDGTGALVTASRSIIYAWQSSREAEWRTAVREAARTFASQLAAIRP